MNLVTGSILSDFTGVFGNHFDTFSNNTVVTVFKEPQKIVTNTPANTYFGYSQNQELESITYVPVSGNFPAIQVFERIENDTFGLQTKTRNAESIITIKVKPEAKDFIDDGKNEKIVLGGVTYNDISFHRVQNYFGLKYYYYHLKQTY
jgi:hypothetical protein